MAGKANLAAAVLAFGLLAPGATAQAPQPIRFAEITLRLVTTGERQPLQEAGLFASSLPLGKAGTLHRAITVTNETRKTSTTLALALTVTPVSDEAGLLHCVVLSDVKPEGGGIASRAKDLSFTHPGEQLMELFADPATGSHVVLALTARLADSAPPPPPGTMPLLRFLVKVEQWAGAQRAELEALQLQSLGGLAVTHEYSRKVPRWVEGGDAAAADQPQEQLPMLDVSKGTPVVQAGQGFSIPVEPAERPKKKEGEPKEGEPPPRRLMWDREYYRLTLTPLSLRDGRLVLGVSIEGQILDPVTRAPLPVLGQRAEKTLVNGEPATFYLTRETTGGPLGFVVWVVPQWGDEKPQEATFPGVPQPQGAAP
jgi:hypothetical protein